MASPTDTVVSRPYYDGNCANAVVTISKAVLMPVVRQNGEEDEVLYGVMGVDVTIIMFYSMMIGSYYPCVDVEGITCILMDQSGYLMSSYGMVRTIRRKTDQPLWINVHITKEAGAVAASLINRGYMNKTRCIDFIHGTEFTTYRMTSTVPESNVDDTELHTFGYKIIHIRDTNMYVVVVSGSAEQKNPCVCSFWESTLPSICLRSPKSECECPCYRYKRRELCTNDIEGNWIPCTPKNRIGKSGCDLSRQMLLHAKTLPPCFKTLCRKRETEETCHRYVDCRWCVVDESGNDLATPYCGSSDECYFGMIGHPGMASRSDVPDNYSRLRTSIYILAALVTIMIAAIIFYKSNVNIFIRRLVHKDESMHKDLSKQKKKHSSIYEKADTFSITSPSRTLSMTGYTQQRGQRQAGRPRRLGGWHDGTKIIDNLSIGQSDTKSISQSQGSGSNRENASRRIMNRLYDRKKIRAQQNMTLQPGKIGHSSASISSVDDVSSPSLLYGRQSKLPRDQRSLGMSGRVPSRSHVQR